MNKYTIKLTIAFISYNAMSLGFHVGGEAVEDLNRLRVVFRQDVQGIINDVVTKQAEEFFANAATGALSQLTSEKAQELGSSIGQGILSQLTPEKTKEIGDNLGASLGDKFGENLVKGVATGVVGVASSAGKAVTTKVAATYTATKVAAASAVTSAKTTTAAALASPAAPFVVGGIVVTGVGVATYYAGLDRRDDLAGYAELGKVAEARLAVGPVIPDRLVESDQSLLEQVIGVTTDQEVGRSLQSDEALITTDQTVCRITLATLCEGDESLIIRLKSRVRPGRHGSGTDA